MHSDFVDVLVCFLAVDQYGIGTPILVLLNPEVVHLRLIREVVVIPIEVPSVDPHLQLGLLVERAEVGCVRRCS